MINRAVLFVAIVLSGMACSNSKNTVDDTEYPTTAGIWKKQPVTIDVSDKEWDKSSMSFPLESGDVPASTQQGQPGDRTTITQKV